MSTSPLKSNARCACLDGAVAVFDAVAGVEAAVRKPVLAPGRQVSRARAFCFVNKMDRTGARPSSACIDMMIDRLGNPPR